MSPTSAGSWADVGAVALAPGRGMRCRSRVRGSAGRGAGRRAAGGAAGGRVTPAAARHSGDGALLPHALRALFRRRFLRYGRPLRALPFRPFGASSRRRRAPGPRALWADARLLSALFRALRPHQPAPLFLLGLAAGAALPALDAVARPLG